MTDYDEDATDLAVALKDALGATTMSTPVEEIVAAGRRRRGRRRMLGVAVGATAVAGLALGVATYGGAGTAVIADDVVPGGVHIHTVGYTVDSRPDGAIEVTWDKQRYFEDHQGLEAALRAAGFPVLMKVGEFCRGPQDDGTLSPGGVGPGVDKVMHGVPDPQPDPKQRVHPDGPDKDGPDKDGAGESRPAEGGVAKDGPGKESPDADAGRGVEMVFNPSAMPAGMQLFIGYLNPEQLAVTGGAPGSVERLVPIGVPLTCTTEAPPAHR
jgi:hypothetical protein